MSHCIMGVVKCLMLFEYKCSSFLLKNVLNVQACDATGDAIQYFRPAHNFENINEEQLPPNPKELLNT